MARTAPTVQHAPLEVGASLLPMSLFICAQPELAQGKDTFVFDSFPPMLHRQAHEALQRWALRDLDDTTILTELDWEGIQRHMLPTSSQLWDAERDGDLDCPDTQEAIRTLRRNGFAMPSVLAGTHQHFGGWLMDYCVVAAAVRMAITPKVKKYTAVHNMYYAMVAAGTNYPDDVGVSLSLASQERVGNIFETLAGLMFIQREYRALRRFILFMATVVYRTSMGELPAARTMDRLVVHRRRQLNPTTLSESLQVAGA